MMADELTITRGQAQMDAGLIEVGLDEYQRLAVWEAALNAMIEQVSGTNLDLGLAEIITPGNYLLLDGLSGGPVAVEVGVPHVVGAEQHLRVPLRRFGSATWDLGVPTESPVWWRRARARLVPGRDWDEDEDLAGVAAEIEAGFERVWMEGRWLQMAWWRSRPGWVDAAFPRCHKAMKRGLLRALGQPQGAAELAHVPVLAGGGRLSKISAKNLAQPATELFPPSESGYREFIEEVEHQRVSRSNVAAMALSWWGRTHHRGAP